MSALLIVAGLGLILISLGWMIVNALGFWKIFALFGFGAVEKNARRRDRQIDEALRLLRADLNLRQRQATSGSSATPFDDDAELAALWRQQTGGKK